MSYFKFGRLIQSVATTATSGGTLSLTKSSHVFQRFTGTMDHIVELPDATTIVTNWALVMENRSTGRITVNDFGGNLVGYVLPGTERTLFCTNTGTAAGSWSLGVGERFETPARFWCTGSDAVIRFGAENVYDLDGGEVSIPPISNQIPDLLASTYNLQTGATTGNTFVGATLPSSTVGQYRLVGFTLLGDGSIQVLFSPESVTIPGLANPGTVFAAQGLPIGWLILEATAATAFKSAGATGNLIVTQVGGDARLFRFGNGGGAGGGAGDASELQERLKHRLIDAPFSYLNDNIFSQVGQDKIAAATASFNLVDQTFGFAMAGEEIESVQVLDDDYIATGDDVTQLELMAFWHPDEIDTAAVYEASKDGGASYDTVTMTRVGQTETFRGVHIFDEPPSVVTEEYALSNGDFFGDLNITTTQSLAQSFAIASGETKIIKSATIVLNKIGTPSGAYRVKLVADDSGSPSTNQIDDIAVSVDQQVSALSAGSNTVTVPLPKTALGAGTYWLVVETDAAYKSSFVVATTLIQLRGDISAPPGPNGQAYDGSVWGVIPVMMVYELNGHLLDVRIKITSSTSPVALKGYGVFYGLIQGVATDQMPFERVLVPANTSPTSITLTRFLPHPDLLKCHVVGTGQTLTYGAFSLNGYDVGFAANFFNLPVDTTLFFEQLGGASFDNSDLNAALMAANFLGSTDPSIDRSQPGRGIFLRRPDGVLREATLDNTDNWAVYSV